MCGKSTTNTSTSSTSPSDPTLLNAYKGLISRAQTTADTPYQAYTGELTAGLNAGQKQAIGQLEGSYGLAFPAINAGLAAAGNATTYQGAAAGLANPYATAAYMSPYLNSAVAATRANIDQSNAEQQSQLQGQAIGAGAFGGDRSGIAAASLARQQGLAEGQTLSSMENQGYQMATQARQADAGIYGNLANSADQTAQIYGGLGSLAQSTAIQGASAGLQGATLQQQTQQAQDTAAYQQWMNGRAYPFQTTGWLGNLMTGVGSQEGSTTTGTTPGPSGLSQAAGVATTGLGILGATGAFGSGGWLTSDERAKDDIEPIGKTFDGQTIHRWTYKGDPNKTVHTGLIAQEVEGRHPEAVRDVGGLKQVEYGAATDGAAARGKFADGGIIGGLRPAFDNGGGLGSIPYAGNGLPTLASSTQGLDLSPTGLTQGVSFDTAPTATPKALAASPMPQGLGVVTAPPVNLQPASGNSSSAGLGAVGGGDPDHHNLWMGVMAAGLGMMGGTSPFAAVNIGQGGLAGLKEYQGLQANDRADALAKSEIDTRKAQLGISQQDVDLRAQQLHQAMTQQAAQLAIQQGTLDNQTANTSSEIQARGAQTAASLQTMTPAGILQRDPANPMAPPKLIPFSALAGSGVTPSGPQSGGAGPQSGGPAAAPSGAAPQSATVATAPDNIPPDPRAFSQMGQDIVKNETNEGLKDARTAAVAAQGTQLSLQQMQHDLTQLPSTGFLAAGPGQQQRAALAAKVNTTLNGLGLPDYFDASSIASSEALKKLTNRMGFDMAKSLGGREPGFIVQQAVGSVPSSENTPIGAQRLIASLQQTAQRQTDYYTFLQDWSGKTGGSIKGADEYFNAKYPPSMYATRAVLSTIPDGALTMLRKNPDLKTQFDAKYGAGTSAMALGQ